MSSELAAIDWLGRGWLLLLAFTAAVLLVAALRKPCRHLFGTERAFHLWLLPPLAMLASQLPHAAVAPVAVLSGASMTTLATTISSAPPIASMHGVDWLDGVAALWLAGITFSLLSAVRAQARYRTQLQGALRLANPSVPCPVLRATTSQIGPALVGAWRTRVVLPADFEQRYSPAEQSLILAHEAMHARRCDGWWCLFGRLFTAAFWFHPLAWWALATMRQDQELACDAAVMRERGAQRRSYAQAMLKTQSAAMALPVGCPWSPRHPVTERIAMLKLKQPDANRRRIGAVFVVLIAVALVGAVYAATPAPQTTAVTGSADHYTLKIDASMSGDRDTSHFSYCLAPGEYATASGTGTPADRLSWKGRFAVAPAPNGQLLIRSQVDTRFDRGHGNVHAQSAKPVVRTAPGQAATVQFGQVTQGKHEGGSEDNTIKLVLTPLPGCEAGVSTNPVVEPPERAATADNAGAREYQLNMSIGVTRDDGKASRDRRVNMALCMGLGKPASVNAHGLNVSTRVTPGGDGRLGIDVTVADESGKTLAETRLLGRPNELVHAGGRGADHHARYSVDITPLEGCPARTAGKTKVAAA
jgi:beta-lactamase regulating signal transducer with metallopeptidase domain